VNENIMLFPKLRHSVRRRAWSFWWPIDHGLVLCTQICVATL